MKILKFDKYAYVVIGIWLVALLVGSLYSPPSFISDPGLGFLDMINFSEGGKFQHHKMPFLNNPDICIQERTTWWTPGQWYFIYLITLLGIKLGTAISLCVFISTAIGIVGWYILYRKFEFDKIVVVISILLIAFSRYFYSSFQIYPGANILEFSVAPWLLLFWLKSESLNSYFRIVLIFLLIIFSFFIKSSMLIFWLALILSRVSIHYSHKNQWFNLFLLASAFVLGKYFCDFLFIKGGYTPFSWPGEWIRLNGIDFHVLTQKIIFTLSGPILSTIGIDDYVKYIFQKPGNVIINDGSIFLIGIYLFFLILFIALLINSRSQKKELNKHYFHILYSFVFIFILFFFYTLLSGKAINAYEESRHFRLAGLILLPLVVKSLNERFRIIAPIITLFMIAYSIPSNLSKIKSTKVISEKYRTPFSEIENEADYKMFKNMAEESDYTYVIHAGLAFELDQCKTFYNQDDYTPIEKILERKKIVLKNKKIVFLLPERFKENGKLEAILGNFTQPSSQSKPLTTTTKLSNWYLVKIEF